MRHLPLLVLSLVAACGGGDDASTGSTGSAGKAGASGATSGAGGSVGKAGSTPAGGAGSAAKAGAAQAGAGSAGKAGAEGGSAGTAGTAGQPHAGAGGQGGAGSAGKGGATGGSAGSTQGGSAGIGGSAGNAPGGAAGAGGSAAGNGGAGAAGATGTIYALAGVNLSGAEFGESKLPGTHGTDYMYPTHQEVDHFVGKGMNVFRLPFRWERLQPSQLGALDAAELSRLDDLVVYITSKNASVLLDPHNYARYQGKLVGSDVPASALADFWSKLATAYKGNPRVIFGLMNEPNTMPTEQWRDDANAAIAAIRAAGATNLVFIPGNAWTGAHSWEQNWYGTANAEVMLGIVDAGDNHAFEVHQYLDGDSSGQGPDCVSKTIGSERLAAFTAWLKKHKKRGFLGEFAGGRNDTCYAALDDMLAHVQKNGDVWMGWTYWAAGPWWGDYIYTLEPSGGADRPQMAPLQKHLP